jgi:hypothetical protein
MAKSRRQVQERFDFISVLTFENIECVTAHCEFNCVMDEAFGIGMEELERTGQAEDYFQVKSAAAIRENPRAQHLATRSTTTYL